MKIRITSARRQVGDLPVFLFADETVHTSDTGASQLGVCGRGCGGFPCYIVFVGF